MPSFADRLCLATKSKKTPAMVGIDPRWDLLPDIIRSDALKQFGESPQAVAAGYEKFVEIVIDQVKDLVPIVKFQAAFFELLGAVGMIALENGIKYAKKNGLLIILDGKRGDIGSTAEAYAQGYLGDFVVGDTKSTGWAVDSMTVHPYLGAESLAPFRKTANEYDAGVFVLVRTSNPGAGELQDLKIDGKSISQRIADWVEQCCEEDRNESPYGPIGAVVGATVPEQIIEFREQMPHSVLLIPGYGAQGGTAAEIKDSFDAGGLGAVVNSSRGILFAYKKDKYADLAWEDSITQATNDMIADLAQHTPAGKLQ